MIDENKSGRETEIICPSHCGDLPVSWVVLGGESVGDDTDELDT